MIRSLPPRSDPGFTLIEVMVGVVIFVVGLIGFAGMTMMQAQGNRVAKGSDEAATLLQSAIEDFANVAWNALGTDASAPSLNGLNGGSVYTIGPLNKIGQESGAGSGPYSYFRSIVICTSATTGVTVGGSPTYCGGNVTGTYRPPELACDNLNPALSTSEKLIRALVGWTDRNGRCHYKVTNSLSFNW
ncbi:MAG: prepilin-type N-terminal cleavage/methylation domain-containing protein [Pseudomonadota bacterium]